MKKIVAGGLLLIALSLLAACGAKLTPGASFQGGGDSSGMTAGYQQLSPSEAKKRIDVGGVTIVDVRTEAEYAKGHLPDAVLVSNESIGAARPEKLPDPDAVLLVYCRTGIRSRQASHKLLELGYANVYDIGGITAWPYEIVSEEESAS